MPLREHLVELRRRVVLAALGLLLGAVAGWLLYDPVIAALQQPVVRLEREGLVALNFAGVATSFDLKVKVSLFLGVLVSSPWWILQLWLFVTPGLTRKERRSAIVFLAASVPLFLAGSWLAWRVLPNAVRLLTEFTPDGATNLIDAQLYLSFVMRVILAFGIAFLLPVIMVGVNLAGLVRGSTWLHGWRWAVLLVMTFAAFATPTPDVVTMFVVALPMLALYFLAVGVCVLHDRRDDARRAALTSEAGATPVER
ncbi:preprotein translocase subunit TatC [Actinotalea ferrariae CF5-4]|uniref:Sec-independent protein translocase protein TatC n=1 Tax=Actinotalea ferrariae CF5-4 TaxID=948458 RepID=A0A021VVY3_9CELL|nr:twin-arginine translocase subunit TatC [Actinotalea ferrariae]EYR63237.1 preprotein translocase subunit TatC [Actinotalea ferrariae CF5-4]